MKKSIVLSALLLAISCQSQKNQNFETLVFEEPVSKVQFFTDLVDSIDIIQLDSNGDIMISNTPSLIVSDSAYYIRNFATSGDRQISDAVIKFGLDGKFLSRIGGKENGISNVINNFFLNSDTIGIVTAEDSTINYFKTNGDLLNKVKISKGFAQAYKHKGETILFRNSQHNASEYIDILNDKGETTASYLPIKTKVTPFFETSPVFTITEENILFRLAYSSTIYNRTENGFEPKLVLDFGDKNKAMDEYLSSNGASEEFSKMAKDTMYSITKFYESANFYALELFNGLSVPEYRCIYMIKDKRSGKVSYYNFEGAGTYLNNSLQFLKENKLYFIVDANNLATIPEEFKSRIRNKNAFNEINPTGNSVIVIISLK